ncbi:Succinate dehydrogenase subunit 6 mitochondrial [Zea mays]|uniref:Succinate dehydrogenase subunit 6 mitochondrial n=1 Tax=Zea mays TaxID=4577 RepID=A0A1D6PX17_MAIZE|nr:Succinate dehydrogenase subunit 6 mitochondrial [Zea mays]
MYLPKTMLPCQNCFLFLLKQHRGFMFGVLADMDMAKAFRKAGESRGHDAGRQVGRGGLPLLTILLCLPQPSVVASPALAALYLSISSSMVLHARTASSIIIIGQQTSRAEHMHAMHVGRRTRWWRGRRACRAQRRR